MRFLVLDLDVPEVTFSQKSEPRARANLPFYRVAPRTCVAGHLEYWYQSVTKADANGDRGGCHLHGPRHRLQLDKSNLCGCHSDHVL